MADNKSGASEAFLGWGMLLGIMAALGYLMWWLFDDQIKNVVRWFRYGELWVAALIRGNDTQFEWRGADYTYGDVLSAAERIPAEQINGDFMALLSTAAMDSLIPVIVLLTVAFAFWVLFRGAGTEHRTRFDLDGLIKKQANMFPIIAPMIDFNPAKMPARAPGSPVPVNLPLFAEALGPEEWVVHNEIPVTGKDIDEEAAALAFGKQLGARWRGAKQLEPYMQVMLAAFCLKAARKRADSDSILSKLALCWSEKNGLKINTALLREAHAVLANAAIAGPTLKKCNEHAWETTALMRALSTAREEGGVLAPAQFVWLRAHNRALWYPLNNLGRQSYHMEAVGAMAHYKAEKLARRPIPRPKVLDAVKSLAEYISSSKSRPLPQLDYTGSKKRGVKKIKAA
jgi:intracellular multiplication protein IcmP